VTRIDRGQRFDPVAASVPAARRYVATRLEAARFGGNADTVLLLTSELATNAVRHAATPFWVDVEVDGDQATVSVVDDDGSHLPVPGTPTLDATNGRGLRIVDDLAARWGHRPAREHGKSVWFTGG
jgi:two-component sensor histidine kinase